MWSGKNKRNETYTCTHGTTFYKHCLLLRLYAGNATRLGKWTAECNRWTKQNIKSSKTKKKVKLILRQNLKRKCTCSNYEKLWVLVEFKRSHIRRAGHVRRRYVVRNVRRVVKHVLHQNLLARAPLQGDVPKRARRLKWNSLVLNV